MLEIQNLYFAIPRDGEDFNLLSDISLKVPRGHFMAIVGPSGCGKTTLLKTIAGINAETDGHLIWDGRDLAEDKDFEPNEIGYVPQFSIAYDQLTVDESIEACAKLRVNARSNEDLDHRIDRVLEETGMTSIADRPVKVLSGGQKRRLALAMELVSDPHLLLCDEVTSGLDPRSEHEIVQLLHQLSRREGRVVISVTHSLAHLELYDSILVLHEGRVAYHGPASALTHYFGVEDTENVYPQLTKRAPDDWKASWLKKQDVYYQKLEEIRQRHMISGELIIPREFLPEDDQPRDGVTKERPLPAELPNVFSQFLTLTARRWKIFFRDRGQLILQLAMVILFPILVTLFCSKGQEPISKLSATRDDNIVQEIQQQQMVQANSIKVGSAVSGIVMFEVILLGLMGSNNAAREIAGERNILEKEKYGGVSSIAYLGSKVAFLGTLVLVQSLYMFFFVQFFWGFRGDAMSHLTFLILANAAMTAVCLAISSMAKTADQASLLSIYLVGFQLPLSGAVLALPTNIEQFVRPFISAYWAWSGSLNSLDHAVLNAVKLVVDTSLLVSGTCLIVLFVHILVGLGGTWLGLSRHQWD